MYLRCWWQTLGRESHLCMLLLSVYDSVTLTDRGTDNRRGTYRRTLYEFSSRKENVIYCLQQYFYHPILFSFLLPNTFCLLHTSLCLVLCKTTSFRSLQVPQGSCVTVWSHMESMESCSSGWKSWLLDYLVDNPACCNSSDARDIGPFRKVCSHAYQVK